MQFLLFFCCRVVGSNLCTPPQPVGIGYWIAGGGNDVGQDAHYQDNFLNWHHLHYNSKNINPNYWVLDTWYDCPRSIWYFRHVIDVALTAYLHVVKWSNSRHNNTRTFINFSLTPIMTWCERALEKCERPKDESHHAQRKSHQALKSEN